MQIVSWTAWHKKIPHPHRMKRGGEGHSVDLYFSGGLCVLRRPAEGWRLPQTLFGRCGQRRGRIACTVCGQSVWRIDWRHHPHQPIGCGRGRLFGNPRRNFNAAARFVFLSGVPVLPAKTPPQPPARPSAMPAAPGRCGRVLAEMPV